jgi:hypothetical protein
VTWRTYAAEQLRQYAPLTAQIPTRQMLAAGSMTARPESVPFLIIEIGSVYTGPFPGVSEQDLYIHVHDEPGDFMRIDEMLRLVRLAMMSGSDLQTNSARIAGGIACSWANDSRDLSDDMYRTIYKTSSYTLRGIMTNA